MRLFSLVVAALLLLAGPIHTRTAEAQRGEGGLKVGPRLTADVADIDDIALGGTLRIGSPSIPVQGSGAFDLYLSEGDATVFTVDLNAQVPFDVGRWFTPYVGAGLGITRVSGRAGGGSTTDLGFNALGGAEMDLRGILRPFVQAQLTLGDTFDRIGFTGGVLFDI